MVKVQIYICWWQDDIYYHDISRCNLGPNKTSLMLIHDALALDPYQCDAYHIGLMSVKRRPG